MTHRSRHHRAHEGPPPLTGSRRSPAPLIVELANNAPVAMVAAVQEAIRVVAPLTAVELVRVPPRPRGEELRIRGPLVAWSAPADAGRRQYRAMDAFAAAFEVALGIIHDGGHRPRPEP